MSAPVPRPSVATVFFGEPRFPWHYNAWMAAMSDEEPALVCRTAPSARAGIWDAPA